MTNGASRRPCNSTNHNRHREEVLIRPTQVRRSHLTGIPNPGRAASNRESPPHGEKQTQAPRVQQPDEDLELQHPTTSRYAETPEDPPGLRAVDDGDARSVGRRFLPMLSTSSAPISGTSRVRTTTPGASVTILISRAAGHSDRQPDTKSPRTALPDTILAHLDKSHITVHTLPKSIRWTVSRPSAWTSTFHLRSDLPLKAWNYLIHQFDSDIVTVDYGSAASPATSRGASIFIDHEINSIQNYLSDDTREAYQMTDVNVYQENPFHTKMLSQGLRTGELPVRRRYPDALGGTA